MAEVPTTIDITPHLTMANDMAARIAELEQRLAMASEFTVGECERSPVLVVRRGQQWAVWCGGDVLNADYGWEHEPHASSRSDEFLARTRFALDEALERARAVCDGEAM